MGKYEQLAIDLMESAFGDRWVRDDSRVFSFGPDAGTGEVDGTIDGRIAVEIGVGSPKQLRASVLDLALHPYPGKLLVLVDTPGHSTERSAGQAEAILDRLGCPGLVFRVSMEDDLNGAGSEAEADGGDVLELNPEPTSSNPKLNTDQDLIVQVSARGVSSRGMPSSPARSLAILPSISSSVSSR